MQLEPDIIREYYYILEAFAPLDYEGLMKRRDKPFRQTILQFQASPSTGLLFLGAMQDILVQIRARRLEVQAIMSWLEDDLSPIQRRLTRLLDQLSVPAFSFASPGQFFTSAMQPLVNLGSEVQRSWTGYWSSVHWKQVLDKHQPVFAQLSTTAQAVLIKWGTRLLGNHDIRGTTYLHGTFRGTCDVFASSRSMQDAVAVLEFGLTEFGRIDRFRITFVELAKIVLEFRRLVGREPKVCEIFPAIKDCVD
jgi:hypothetical protein